MYKNMTETMVKEVFEEVKDNLDCCLCELCTGDILTFALNQLPPKYVMSHAGETAARMQGVDGQERADVKTAIYRGSARILENPRH